jgi:hypothetical protein
MSFERIPLRSTAQLNVIFGFWWENIRSRDGLDSIREEETVSGRLSRRGRDGLDSIREEKTVSGRLSRRSRDGLDSIREEKTVSGRLSRRNRDGWIQTERKRRFSES